MIKKTIFLLFLTICSCALFFLCAIYFLEYILIGKNIKISVSEYINNDLKYKVTSEFNGNSKNLLCSIDSKNWTTFDNCNFDLSIGEYKLYVKNNYFLTSKNFDVKKNIKGTFTSSLDKLDTYYLALGGKKELEFSFEYNSDFDTSLIYKIENDEIVEVKDNVLYGKKVGTTNITVMLKDGNSKSYKIMVTDLIVPMRLNRDKDILPCGRYTKEENELLDKILESRVIEAGIGTRGGTIAAIRFITLEFPYSIKYYYENGRLVDHGYRVHLDGEGRYYHKGLYLNEYKFSELEKGASSKDGPKTWGCGLYNFSTHRNDLNGFDCSGFVTWAFLNGGYDVGDVGAGEHKEYNDELSDLGVRNKITKDYIENGKYKVGDFIARNGHAALIIGIDKNNIYTAEALPPVLKIHTYDKKNKIFNNPNVKYIIELDNVYPNGDGIYTDLWNEVNS